MKSSIKYISLFIITLIISCAPPSSDYQKGLDAALEGDFATAMKLWRPLAEQGNATAQYNISLMYANGDGVPQNNVEALKWSQLAANQGVAQAQYNVGSMYDNGTGVLEDDTEALKWYRLAADQGIAEAQFNLGLMYANGEGVPQDEAEALKWYQLAADQGDTDAKKNKAIIETKNANAYYDLGLIYEDVANQGENIQTNKVDAVKMYRLAAELGHTKAQFKLSRKLAFGKGVEKDKKEAREWLLKSANTGYAEAQFYLGIDYYFEKDYTEALKWYRLAAEQGYADAEYEMGDVYNHGDYGVEINNYGVKVNKETALVWYRRAATQGHGKAELYLARLYYNGGFVEQDYKEAMKWYRSLADSGFALAEYYVGSMYEEGKGVEKNNKEAIKWYLLASEKSSSKTLFNILDDIYLDLGNIYANDESLPNNKEEALKWYELAAGEGSLEASNIIKDGVESIDFDASTPLNLEILDTYSGAQLHQASLQAYKCSYAMLTGKRDIDRHQFLDWYSKTLAKQPAHQLLDISHRDIRWEGTADAFLKISELANVNDSSEEIAAISYYEDEPQCSELNLFAIRTLRN